MSSRPAASQDTSVRREDTRYAEELRPVDAGMHVRRGCRWAVHAGEVRRYSHLWHVQPSELQIQQPKTRRLQAAWSSMHACGSHDV